MTEEEKIKEAFAYEQHRCCRDNKKWDSEEKRYYCLMSCPMYYNGECISNAAFKAFEAGWQACISEHHNEI